MVIDVASPEFDSVIMSYMMPAADEFKSLELALRKSAASVQKTDKEYLHILRYSEAFVYSITVKGGVLSVERTPPGEDDPVMENIRVEASQIIKSLLPERINTAMSLSRSEIKEIIRPRIIEEVQKIIGGELS